MIDIAPDITLSGKERSELIRLLGREPSTVELQLFDVLWSEHCSYKSSRPTLKEFLPTEGPTVLQGPEEDAGILHFTEWQGVRYGLVIAHESHNHPSQILPVEGAATGIGGIVRDVVCMGGELIGVLDPLRFGDVNGKRADHSIAIARGVVKGIAQYANALGVPNLGGDLFFDRSFDQNCLVNVVAVGLVEEDRVVPSAVPRAATGEKYVFLLVGKPTDSTGFGGATMASRVLDGEETENRGAVQVPDPFLKRVLNVALHDLYDRAQRRGIPFGCKDLGAGGIACMASEIADRGGVGVTIDLDRVPLAEEIPPFVAAVAETQERYGLALPASFVEEALALFNEEYDLPSIYRGARAAVVGEFTEERRVKILFKGETVCDAAVEAITTAPVAARVEGAAPETAVTARHDLPPEKIGGALLAMLASPNGGSAEPLFRSYDQEVKGNALLRPGEADASVILPIHGCPVGAAFTVDGNPRYGALDPWAGGAHAVLEAARNLACIGAAPLGITDCLNYGNPEDPEVFSQFRGGVRGLCEAVRRIGLRDDPGHPIPVVSGNVSFYNQSETGSAVAPSPVICMAGIVLDGANVVTLRLKEPGDAIFLVGRRRGDLGGSLYHDVVHGDRAGAPPRIAWDEETAALHAVSALVGDGLARACHDIGAGGMLFALAEMIVAAGALPAGVSQIAPGATIEIDRIGTGLSPAETLFCEAGGFLIEVDDKGARALCAAAERGGFPVFRIGEVTERGALEVRSGGETIVNLDGACLFDAWDGALRGVFQGV